MPSAIADWAKILQASRPLLEMAYTLVNTGRRPAPDSAAATDVQVLRQRLVDLDKHREESTKLLTQLTEHIQAITLAAQANAARARQAFFLAIASIVAAIAAVAIAMLR